MDLAAFKDLQQFWNVGCLVFLFELFHRIWPGSGHEHRLLLWIQSVQVPGKLLLGSLEIKSAGKTRRFAPVLTRGMVQCNGRLGTFNSLPTRSEVWCHRLAWGRCSSFPQSIKTMPKICSVLGMRTRSQPCPCSLGADFSPLPENNMLLLTLPYEGERDPKAGGAQLCRARAALAPAMLFTCFCPRAGHPCYKAQPLYISTAISMR